MESSIKAPARTLPVLMIAAVAQGLALYLLHIAIKTERWPANDPAWLTSLYTLAIFIPATVQLLAAHIRSAAHWSIVTLIAAIFFYFGWHNASVGAADKTGMPFDFLFPSALVLSILWLMLLPFVQSRLALGRWNTAYDRLFANAWFNKLLLLQAAAFTAIFWFLLFLWQALFHMLGIDYFRDLFQEPVFVYPVSALTFGLALHLIASTERLTTVALEQTLNLLKWLALLVGFILVIFTIALLIKFPGVVFTGQSAIGADWLLGLVAIFVALLNAAYRDGGVPQPYPGWIGRALSWAVPLTVIVTLTAIYALMVRAQHYGLTVARFWACVVAGAALIYSVGYSVAAFGKTGWLRGIARVNVVTAVALIVTLALALTPLLSPYRLAANSQFKQVLRAQNPEDFTGQTPFHYLRFDAGNYGRGKLLELEQLRNHPHADVIRKMARASSATKQRWEPAPAEAPGALIDGLAVYPAGHALEPALREQLITDLSAPRTSHRYRNLTSKNTVGIFTDLNGDTQDEFVLLTGGQGFVYQQSSGQWRYAIRLSRRNDAPWESVVADLRKRDFGATLPAWRNLSIGKHLFVAGQENLWELDD